MFKFLRTAIPLIFCLFLLSTCCFGQVKTRVILGEKGVYSPGDAVTIQILVTVNPKTCIDGMALTKIYARGMEIKKRAGWKEQKPGIWENLIICTISNSKKGFGMLTIVRRTDKDQFMVQLKFET